jgi:phosphatidylglycerophosphatase A
LLKSTPRSDTFSWRKSFRNSKWSGKTGLLLSAGFGVGLVPRAPGTVASLATLPLAFGMSLLGLPGQTIFLAVSISLAIWACDRAWRTAREDDPSWVVIDEVVGLLLTFYGVRPTGALELVLGFALFRLLDIWKPGPIRRMERLPGAKGIVMDDLLAGAIANLCLQVIHLIG